MLNKNFLQFSTSSSLLRLPNQHQPQLGRFARTSTVNKG